MIELENGVKLNRQTVYYHETKYSDDFLTQEENNLHKALKEAKIEPSGIYHYDEEFLRVNGENFVRLTLIDTVNNLIINDQIIYQEYFGSDFIEIFLKYSLEGLPKKVLITDGHVAYPAIIEGMYMKHQLCTFHLIKNHNTGSFKKINKLERKIKSLKRKIKDNEERINKLKEHTKGIKGRTPKNDKKRIRRIKKIKKLKEENRQNRKELKQLKKALKEQERINERISNIYKTDTKKAATRRFKTIYTQLDQFDENTQSFLKNLRKKFNNSTTYFENNQIPKTNNKIEGYYKITLPKPIKKIYRTTEGLMRWIRQQEIRWSNRNTL